MVNNMYEKFETALQLINDEVPETICTTKQSQPRLISFYRKRGCLVRAATAQSRQVGWV